jgi:large subunit ribosomal protein L18Ae
VTRVVIEFHYCWLFVLSASSEIAITMLEAHDGRFSQLYQYEIVGRKYPTPKEPKQPLYKMTIFAPNETSAKSRFWYFLSQLRKMKKTTGQIVNVKKVSFSPSPSIIASAHSAKQVTEKRQGVIRTYGIWLRYDSRSGTHNMYREFRDVALAGAVSSLCEC